MTEPMIRELPDVAINEARLNNVDSHELAQWRAVAREAERCTLEQVREKVAIELRKSIVESAANPFPVENLNKEYKLLWRGHANGLSDFLSEIDNSLQELKKLAGGK